MFIGMCSLFTGFNLRILNLCLADWANVRYSENQVFFFIALPIIHSQSKTFLLRIIIGIWSYFNGSLKYNKVFSLKMKNESPKWCKPSKNNNSDWHRYKDIEKRKRTKKNEKCKKNQTTSINFFAFHMLL